MKNKVEVVKNRLIDIYGDLFQIHPFELYIEGECIVFEFMDSYVSMFADEFSDIENELYECICDEIDLFINAHNSPESQLYS